MTRWLPALSALLLAGCPYLGDGKYTDKVRDVDGDGLVAERFGGPDCDDTDPDIGDCDADGDGVRSTAAGGEDCDDTDATVFPGAPERCDGRDHDCDGLVGNDDEDIAELAPQVYPDGDGDGFGRDDGAKAWCGPAPAGFVSAGELGDCDDGDAARYPGADERCDATDWDCDGDPLLDAVDATAWWADGDNDGFGAGDTLAVQCDPPDPDAVPRDLALEDCAPGDGSIHPGADEVAYDGIDQDCDGEDLVDVDNDGFVGGPEGVDCDDTSPLVHPDQDESCNGVDDDCDGIIDEGVATLWYPDYDADGHGDPTGLPVSACTAPAQHVASTTDCDDTTAERAPTNTEVCDGIDNDCDGVVDGGAIDEVVRYPDTDGDTFGDPDAPFEGCLDDLPEGTWVEDDQDCDDTRDRVFPGAEEICDLLDNDCNELVDDDASDAVLAYVDADDDLFGDPTQPVMVCTVEEGLSVYGTDCDDGDPDAYPGATEICFDAVRQDCSGAPVDDCDGDGTTDALDCGVDDPSRYVGADEVCDGIDNDCDDLVDSDDPGVDGSTARQWYRDLDGDGFSDGVLVGAVACDPPPDSTDQLGDCDDGDATAYPFADELCDGVDNDCDDAIDEAPSDPTPWYVDLDGDGHGSGPVVLEQCADPGAGYAAVDDDCNDALATQAPGAVEACDGLDNDCDGLVDDDDPDAELVDWYLDGDGDGAGSGTVTAACIPPVDHVATGGDCDDTDPERRPGATELCDGVDNDCDELTDFDDPDLSAVTQWLPDSDGDGVVTFTPGPDGDPIDSDADGLYDEAITSCTRPVGYEALVADGDGWLLDCDDTDAQILPGAVEVCDGVDNDCDGLVDAGEGLVGPLWFADTDGDGWGDVTAPLRSCEQPEEHVVLAGDCDDDEATAFPGATEDCTDGIDNDCDGFADDDDPGAASQVWYYDGDGDGYGDPVTASPPQCAPPVGPPAAGDWVVDGSDCDDTRVDVGPGLPELCDGVDNDCDEVVDDDDEDVEAPIRFVDGDGDGFGGEPVLACLEGDGVVDEPGDCDDADPGVNPGAPEVCTDSGPPVDEDCDGLVDINLAPVFLDGDGDGFGDPDEQRLSCSQGVGLDWVANSDDCDDTDGTISPDAIEVCNASGSIDDDCDGLVDTVDPDLDSATLTTWVPDQDRDGVYDLDQGVMACEPPTASWSDVAVVPAGDDCDDASASVFPGATEACDGIDNDCVDGIDNVDGLATAAWYVDVDGDGFAADDALPTYTCTPAAGLVQLLGDCDDTNTGNHPGGVEACDGGDNDCDGLVDADDPDLSDGVPGFIDADGDGFGADASPALACEAPFTMPGRALVGGDCDDDEPSMAPDLDEICSDGLDNDCSGAEDDDPPSGDPFAPDRDGDGVYDLSEVLVACADPDGAGSLWFDAGALVDDDCDDQAADIYPGAAEVCDGVRNDCTGLPADQSPTDGVAYYPDLDGDLFGDEDATPVVACSPPAGYVLDATDCLDTDAGVRPGLPIELCANGVDDNCDGFLDEAGTESSLVNAYEYVVVIGDEGTNPDVDGDGFVDEVYTLADLEERYSCAPDPVDWVDAHGLGDCDDADSDVHPEATEVCDTIDNDCDDAVDADDNNVDFAGSSVDIHLDLDLDGARGSMIVGEACPGDAMGPGLVLFDEAVDPDCDDGDPGRSPLLAEVCDGIDTNCDDTDDEEDLDGDGYPDCDPSECDDGDPTLNGDTVWLYPDADADGFVGAPSDVVVGCAQPTTGLHAWALESGDCDDADDLRYPGAVEQCDGVDNDCDGQLDASEADGDGDGVSACDDCDDADPNRSPDLLEACDGVDNDCDAVIPADEMDADGDFFVECTGWQGSADIFGGGDCDDSNAVVYPGQAVLAADPGAVPGADFVSIQEAIDAVCDSALIEVDYPPDFRSTGFVLPTDKVVEIRGRGPQPSEMLVPSGAAVIASATPAGTTLRNLKLFTTGDYALTVDAGAQLDVFDLEIRDSDAAGILVQGADTELTCDGCLLQDLTDAEGAAVHASGGASVTLLGSEVIDCVATTDAAVHATNADLSIDGSVFTGNELVSFGQNATALTATGGTLTLAKTSFSSHISGDRQPTILLEGGIDAVVEDVKLVDNPGGIWVSAGGGLIDLYRVDLIRTGGNDDPGNLEGALEIRDASSDVYVRSLQAADNVGPGIRNDTSSQLNVEYATLVGNGFAGLVYVTAGTTNIDHSVFADQPDDIDGPDLSGFGIGGPTDNWYQHSASTTEDCATVVPVPCESGNPAFITFHPTLPSSQWVLRPYPFNAEPLWNNADDIFGFGNVDLIIGHTGGPDGDATDWYADTEPDALYDGWERRWWGDLGTGGVGSPADADADGLHDADELAEGTDPTISDTDGDGASDYCEVVEDGTTNPLDSTSTPASCP